MNKCAESVWVERYFDGDPGVPGKFLAHLEGCTACSDVLLALRDLRRGVDAVREEVEIGDGQFPAFMSGVASELSTPAPGRGGFLAVVSIVAASLIMAVSTFVVFSGEAKPVEAKTEVEYAETELEGATTTVNYSETGPATVWLNVPEGDMW